MRRGCLISAPCFFDIYDMKLLDQLEYAHFEQMAELEGLYYGEAHIVAPQEALACYRKCPCSVVAAWDAGSVVGFISLLPISDDVLTKLRVGRFCGSELTAADVVDVNSSEDGPLHIYLRSIVVEPEYRAEGLSHLLISKAAAQYADVAHRCDVIMSDSITPEGERFLRKYGFVPVCESRQKTWVYSQSYGRFAGKAKKPS